jgi:hypothetical protein
MDRETAEAMNLVSYQVHCSAADLADRAKSFEMFRKAYRKNEAMEENRDLLKSKYGRGKELGLLVTDSKNAIK